MVVWPDPALATDLLLPHLSARRPRPSRRGYGGGPDLSRGGGSSLPFLSMAAAQPRGGDAVLLPVVQGWLEAAAEAEAHAAAEERGAAQRFSDVQYYFSCELKNKVQMISMATRDRRGGDKQHE